MISIQSQRRELASIAALCFSMAYAPQQLLAQGAGLITQLGLEIMTPTTFMPTDSLEVGMRYRAYAQLLGSAGGQVLHRSEGESWPIYRTMRLIATDPAMLRIVGPLEGEDDKGVWLLQGLRPGEVVVEQSLGSIRNRKRLVLLPGRIETLRIEPIIEATTYDGSAPRGSFHVTALDRKGTDQTREVWANDPFRWTLSDSSMLEVNGSIGSVMSFNILRGGPLTVVVEYGLLSSSQQIILGQPSRVTERVTFYGLRLRLNSGRVGYHLASELVAECSSAANGSTVERRPFRVYSMDIEGELPPGLHKASNGLGVSGTPRQPGEWQFVIIVDTQCSAGPREMRRVDVRFAVAP